MKRNVLTASLAVLAACCAAADWPRWRGPDGTAHVPADAAVPDKLPPKPKVLWRVKVGFGLGSPVVSAGRLFHIDNRNNKETAHAVDAASGKTLWSVAVDDAFKDYQAPAGPRDTPTVDGSRVYVQSCRGRLRCLNAEDGKQLWSVSYVDDFQAVFIGERGRAAGASRHGYTGAPLVDADRLFVNVGGRKGAGVVCFDKKSGRVLWKSQSDIAGHSGPVLATIAGAPQVISFTAAGVIALKPDDGTLLWRVPVKTRLGRHVCTPVVVGDTVVVGSYTAGLIGIRVAKSGDGLTAERAWTEKGAAVNFSSPVAVGRHLYGLGPGRMLFCVDPQTGRRAWAERNFFAGMVRKGYASFIVMGDKLLILAEKGQLLLVTADPQAPRLISKVQVCGQNWCHPAYADGKLYLRDDKELLCLQLLQ